MYYRDGLRINLAETAIRLSAGTLGGGAVILHVVHGADVKSGTTGATCK